MPDDIKEISKDFNHWLIEMSKIPQASNIMKAYKCGFITLWELIRTLYDIEIESLREQKQNIE